MPACQIRARTCQIFPGHLGSGGHWRASPSTLPAPGRNLDLVSEVVRRTLEGTGSEPGRIPAGDAARLLDSEFFRHHRVEDLAAEQGVAAIDDLDALADASATKEELDLPPCLRTKEGDDGDSSPRYADMSSPITLCGRASRSELGITRRSG